MSRGSGRTFGDTLKRTRELQKLTQIELARRAGLTAAAISQLEGNDREPGLRTLTKLAKALETSVGYLLGEEEPALPGDLGDLFKDLQGLSADDYSKVRDYTAYLRVRGRPKR